MILRRGLVWVSVALLVACGTAPSSSGAPWRAAHPDPGSVSFLDTSAAGLCALSARYPDEAPTGISFNGAEYIQSSRDQRPSSPPGVEVDHTGDWRVFQESDTTLLLVTPRFAYGYRSRQNC